MAKDTLSVKMGTSRIHINSGQLNDESVVYGVKVERTGNLLQMNEEEFADLLFLAQKIVIRQKENKI